jgi:hypothetical protein
LPTIVQATQVSAIIFPRTSVIVSRTSMPKKALGASRVDADGKRNDQAMKDARQKIWDLLVGMYGKDSTHEQQVKKTKAMFPNGVNLETDAEHRRLFHGLYQIIPSMSCHVSHIEASVNAVYASLNIKMNKPVQKKVEEDVQHVRKADGVD